MRGMKTHLVRAALALIVGAAATVVMTYLPIYLVDRGQGAVITTVYRGTDRWFCARDEVFGLRWVNLQLMDEPLTTPLDDGALPAWAEPPRGPHPSAEMFRVATLASGWPLASMRMCWTVRTTNQNFPVPAELDDQDTSIYYAAEDFVKKNRGGGPGEVTVLWGGAVADFAAYTAAAFVLLKVLGLGRKRAATRPEASAGAR